MKTENLTAGEALDAYLNGHKVKDSEGDVWGVAEDWGSANRYAPFSIVPPEMTMEEIGRALADGKCVEMGGRVFSHRPFRLCYYSKNKEWVSCGVASFRKFTTRARIVEDPSE